MGNAYGYQHSFDDPMAQEFRKIFSLDTPDPPDPCRMVDLKNISLSDTSLKTADRKLVEACLIQKQGIIL